MERRIGPYLVHEEIGRGAAGQVFRAQGPDGREVALKLLIVRPAPETLARFERERDLLASLSSEAGFVPLLDAGSSPHGPYVVMPLLRGGSLRERFLRQGRLPLAAALDLGEALASALAAAHARGIVHRDLKPQNVLYEQDGRLRVADLGLAKLYQSQSGESLSRTGSLRGTIGYMPPEQMLDAKRAGPPADVFAWGAILYEALSGLPAFGQDSPLEAIREVERGHFTPLRQRCPELSPRLAALVESCLAPDPALRCRDGAALLEALEAARAPEAAAGTRAKGLAWGGLALTLLGLGLASASVLGQRSQPSPPQPPPSKPSPSRPPRPEQPPSAPSTAASLPPQPALSPPASGAQPEPSPSGAALKVSRVLAPVARGKVLELSGVLGDYRGRHMTLVTDLAWSAAGDKLASVSLAGRFSLWETSTGLPLSGCTLSQRLFAVDLVPGGQWALLGGDKGVVALDLAGKAELVTLPKRGKCVAALAHPEGKQVFATEGAGLSCYEVPSWQELWHRPQAHAGEGSYVNGLCYVPARDELVTAQGSLKVWSRTGELLRSYELPPKWSSEDVAVSSDGAWIYVSGQVPEVLVFSREGPDEPQRLETGQGGYTRALVTFPDGRLFSGHDTGAILVHTGGERELLGRHSGWIHCLSRGPQGLLASGSNDTTLRVWDPMRRAPLWEPRGHQGPVIAMDLAGDTLASSGPDALRIWSASSGEEREPLLKPEARFLGGPARILAFSPKGRYLARAGKAVLIDDLQGNEQLAFPCPEGDLPNSLTFVNEEILLLHTRAGVISRLNFKAPAPRWEPLERGYLAMRCVPVLGLVLARPGQALIKGPRNLTLDLAQPAPSAAAVGPRGTLYLIRGQALEAIALQLPRTPIWHFELPERGLPCLPALSPGGEWLAFPGPKGQVELIDLRGEPGEAHRVADTLDFAQIGEVPSALAWTDAGELLIGTRHGPILRYRVR